VDVGHGQNLSEGFLRWKAPGKKPARC
jgi:hypothetical protein